MRNKILGGGGRARAGRVRRILILIFLERCL